MNFDKLKDITAGKLKTTGVSAFSELELSKVFPNPEQPRKKFDDIEELAATIKEHGLLQPITVVKKDDGYMIISGERRYKAHLYNESKTIKAHIINVTEDKIEELTLIENIQRNDLTDFETAKHICKLWESGRYAKKSELAAKIGKSDSYISKAFNCLKLDNEIIDHIEENKKEISISVLDEIARVKDKTIQKEVYEKYNSGEITRDEIKSFKEPKYKQYTSNDINDEDWQKENRSCMNDGTFYIHKESGQLVFKEDKKVENSPRENLKKYELEICCEDGILYQSDVIEAYNKGNALLIAHKKYPSYLKEGYIEEEYKFFLTEIEEDLKKEKRYDDAVFEVDENFPWEKTFSEQYFYVKNFEKQLTQLFQDGYKQPHKKIKINNAYEQTIYNLLLKNLELEKEVEELNNKDVFIVNYREKKGSAAGGGFRTRASNESEAIELGKKHYSNIANDKNIIWEARTLKSHCNTETLSDYVSYGFGTQNDIGTYIALTKGDFEGTITLETNTDILKNSNNTNYQVIIKEIDNPSN